MPKIAYISPHFDASGYSEAARQTILALDQSGADVVTRHIKMTNTHGDVPNRIKELESKDLNNVDVLIQHNLPSEFVYKGGVHNVGMFAYETSSFVNSGWADNLALMDTIIVFDQSQLESIANTDENLLEKSFVVPHPLDTDKFYKEYETIDFGFPKSTLKFYTISEFNRRKNFGVLLTSYLNAFASEDDVVLIVKVGKNDRDQVKSMIEDIKSNLNKFNDDNRYPKVILIADHLSEDMLCSLHVTGDVFVSASHGEAFCIPFVEALGFGKPCLVPYHTAFKSYQPEFDINLMVGCTSAPVIGVSNAPHGLYTSDESWWNPLIEDMTEKMRTIYDNKDSYLNDNELIEARKKYVVENFSRKVIGKQLLNLIESRINNASKK
jgi:glycosyltransferase involved in cell wall biosynthesis